MQIVLYTDHMEPITVIKSPFSLRELLELRRDFFDVAVYMPMSLVIPEDVPFRAHMRVRIWFERFHRKGEEHLLFFTDDEETALLLNSEPLPGQRRAYQEEFRRGFATGFASALSMAFKEGPRG